VNLHNGAKTFSIMATNLNGKNCLTKHCKLANYGHCRNAESFMLIVIIIVVVLHAILLSAVMLSAVVHSEWYYAECRYAGYRYSKVPLC
jgi:hypothetical protein